MLMSIDRTCFHIPSFLINVLTLGSAGSTLCGRLYLYRKYVSQSNPFANLAVKIIDGIEAGHCETSARQWRVRAKKEAIHFPKRYSDYL